MSEQQGTPDRRTRVPKATPEPARTGRTPWGICTMAPRTTLENGRRPHWTEPAWRSSGTNPPVGAT